MTSEPSRARPVVTDLTQPFWDAAKDQRLAIQRCQDCGYYNHPPRPLCDRCLSDKLAFEDVSGNGTLWSFTVMHQKSVAGFEESVPYATALIELDEQPMLLLPANLALDDDLAIGRRMRVRFQPVDDEMVLPQFLPASS